MTPIVPSLVDDAVTQSVNGTNFQGVPLPVTGTPAGRNSQPYQARRVCAGNTNCIPICPIQAKYDPSVTLAEALRTGNVDVSYKTVASKVHVDGNGRVSGIDFIRYDKDDGDPVERGRLTAKLYTLAGNATETPP